MVTGVAGAAGFTPGATLSSHKASVARSVSQESPIDIPEKEQARRQSRPADEGKPSGFSLI